MTAAGAERALLGSLLVGPDGMREIADVVQPEDFGRERHRVLYQLLREQYRLGRPMDTVALFDRLEGHPEVAERLGGAMYLAGLGDHASGMDLAWHAGQVTRAAMRRCAVEAGQALAATAQDTSRELDDVVEAAEQALRALAQRGSSATWSSPDTLLTARMADYERRAEAHARGEVCGLGTGLEALDDLLGGIQATDMVVLAARPSMGKTALALNLALSVAQAGLGVAFASLEMSREQLMDRLVVTASGVDAWKLRTGNLAPSDFDQLVGGSEDLYRLPLWVEDTGVATAPQLCAKVRRLAAKQPLGLVVVDYLQLMTGKALSKEERVSTNSRALKLLAMELKVPVLVLSQLNRGVEARQDKRPMMADLRDSGAIEQDADTVCFLYRHAYYHPDDADPEAAEADVAKARNGRTGVAHLRWQPHRQKFTSATGPSFTPQEATPGTWNANRRDLA